MKGKIKRINVIRNNGFIMFKVYRHKRKKKKDNNNKKEKKRKKAEANLDNVI